MASRYRGVRGPPLKCEWCSAGCSLSLLWVDLRLAHAQGSSRSPLLAKLLPFFPLKSPHEVGNGAPDHLQKGRKWLRVGV